MGIATLTVLALAMSMDAFAAALAAGSAQAMRLGRVIQIALIFGTVEALMPVTGWFTGRAAAQWIADWDHWLAFILLSVLGGKMFWESLSASGEGSARTTCGSLRLIVLTALATSIDSMIAGVGLALLETGIMVAALMIGAATTLMTAAGLVLGRVLGTAIGRYAGMGGGIILTLIGLSVLIQHLTA